MSGSTSVAIASWIQALPVVCKVMKSLFAELRAASEKPTARARVERIMIAFETVTLMEQEICWIGSRRFISWRKNCESFV